jgi:hypothetical protein
MRLKAPHDSPSSRATRSRERHKGTRVSMLIDGLNVRMLSEDEDLFRHLTLDPVA